MGGGAVAWFLFEEMRKRREEEERRAQDAANAHQMQAVMRTASTSGLCANTAIGLTIVDFVPKPKCDTEHKPPLEGWSDPGP